MTTLVDHDISGLDIAMNYIVIVGISNRGTQGFDNAGDVLRRQNGTGALGEDLFESGAIDKAFEQEDEGGRLVEAIKGDNVGMFKFSQGAGFALEAFEDHLVFSEIGMQDLHGERDVSFEVPDPKDSTHPACGDKRVYPELVSDYLTY